MKKALLSLLGFLFVFLGASAMAQNGAAVPATYYYLKDSALVWVSHQYIVDTIRAHGYPLRYDVYIWKPAEFYRPCIKYSNLSDRANLTFEDYNRPMYVGTVIIDATHNLTGEIPPTPGKKCLLDILVNEIPADRELAFGMSTTLGYHPIVYEIREPTGRPPEVKLVEAHPGQIEWPVFLAVLLHHKGNFKIYLNGVYLWETFLQGYIKPTPQPPKALLP